MLTGYNLFLKEELPRLGKDEVKRLGGLAYFGKKWNGFSAQEKEEWNNKAEKFNYPNGRPQPVVQEVQPTVQKLPVEKTKMDLHQILLELAGSTKKILIHVIKSGGWEFGDTTSELYSFKDDAALSAWIRELFTEEKEYDNKEDPWKVKQREIKADVYNFNSFTNCKPHETAWDVNTNVTVYNPGSYAKPLHEREPMRSVNLYGPGTSHSDSDSESEE